MAVAALAVQVARVVRRETAGGLQVEQPKRPVPTPIYHFTHVDNLAAIVSGGLLPDLTVRRAGTMQVDVGHRRIKEARRARPVNAPPGGVVAEYVPFYFATRSPMLFAIHRGNVETYTGGCDDLVYLVSQVERVQLLDIPIVITDRNAALAYATHTADLNRLDDLVDWELMAATWWQDTDDDQTRRERRMAECLAYGSVPWVAFTELATRTSVCAAKATAALASLGSSTPVRVRRPWYF